ncbi:50S ribosomal protein L10 [Candidatus Micrarchaeota archaeon]|nr:50S ribosomal protein L10 [Candidatus Micrarchaeota archaeon]
MCMDYKVDPEKPAVKKKRKQVQETIQEMSNYDTVALLDLRNLPDALLQSLRKRIRENNGKVHVLKKAVLTRVLETEDRLKQKTDECEKPVALVLTSQTPYELNQFFKKHRKKRAAKPGDVAESDIVIPEGETDLPPGPALSELKAGGVNVQIKGGKIVVAKESTVAKEGEKLTGPKVKALQSLGVQPFEVTADLVFGYDGEYIYSQEILDIGETIEQDMSSSISQGMNLSLNAGYPTEQNIEFLLGDAYRQSLNLAMNSEVYSSASIEQLLTSALRQGSSLEGMMPAEKEASPKEEPEKKEEKAGGDDASAEKPAEEKK